MLAAQTTTTTFYLNSLFNTNTDAHTGSLHQTLMFSSRAHALVGSRSLPDHGTLPADGHQSGCRLGHEDAVGSGFAAAVAVGDL